MSQLLTPQEVADILKVKKNTVYEMVKRGDLRGFKIGKQLRIDAKEIEAYNMPSRSSARLETNAAQAPVDSAQGPGYGTGDHSVVVCGQDIILDILCNYLESAPYFFRAYRSRQGSYNGLYALYQGQVNVATAHLWDGDTDSYNVPYVKRMLPGVEASLYHLVKRRQGIYVLKGNPKNIKGWADFKREDLTFINREKGSGVRVLVDEHLRLNKIKRKSLRGYDHEANSHLAVAGAVAKGEGDFGIGNEKACMQVSGVDFIPLQEESYDLVIKNEDLDETFAKAIIEIITSAKFKEEIESLGGYDVDRMGVKVY